MFIEILIAILLGVLAGTFTGLIPGLHINMINALITSATLVMNPLYTIIFILSMSITHTFVDAIPAIFLGAPDPSQVLLVLPGHQLFLEGKGYQAIYYTLLGGVYVVILSILSAPLLIISMKWLQPILHNYIGYILLCIVGYLIIKQKKKLASLSIFLLSGIFGIIIFAIPTLNQPFFILLSGLFGISTLLISLQTTAMIVKQHIHPVSFHPSFIPAILLAWIMGFFAAFLPGLGASQVAILAAEWMKKATTQLFLVLLGGISTASMCISLFTLYTLQKARNGSVVAIMDIIGTLSKETLLLLMLVCLIATTLATYITLFLAKHIAQHIHRIPIKVLTICIISAIFGMSFVFDSWIGVLCILTGTILGLLAVHLEVGRHFLMGCLLVPVVLFFM